MISSPIFMNSINNALENLFVKMLHRYISLPSMRYYVVLCKRLCYHCRIVQLVLSVLSFNHNVHQMSRHSMILFLSFLIFLFAARLTLCNNVLVSSKMHSCSKIHIIIIINNNNNCLKSNIQ